MAYAIKMKPDRAAAALASAPMPSGGDAEDAAEGPEDESSETCNATITTDQLQELNEKGSVELQGDDGEKVLLTLDEGEASGSGDEEDEGGVAPGGM